MQNELLTRLDGSPRIPLWLKVAYTAFMAVLIPVYWANYGPTNFLYFCDIALLLTLVGMWKESPLLVSMPAVGIVCRRRCGVRTSRRRRSVASSRA